jgi:hypothetical protein
VKVCTSCGLATEVGPNQEAGMGKRITRASGLTIGLDLGDRFPEGRVLDASGKVTEAFRVRTTASALAARLSGYPPSRVVREVGTHSPWVSRTVAGQGHEAVVANPRRVRLIAEKTRRAMAWTRSFWPGSGGSTARCCDPSCTGERRRSGIAS